MIVVAGVLIVVIAAIVVALAVARRHGPAGPARPARIDPFTIGEPWRQHVSAAQTAQRRYNALTTTIAAGPLKERMVEIGRQVEHGVEECWQIARRGDQLDDALRRIDSTSLRGQLERAADDVTRISLRSQLDTAARIRATRDDTDSRLRLLNTRLGELVAQTAEVSVGADATQQLGSAVDDVVTELQALRLAIEDVDAASSGRATALPDLRRPAVPPL
ncbi:MAG: hypothetical protein ABIQ39_07435, partial [Ilumatobacteraceae bacterium]